MLYRTLNRMIGLVSPDDLEEKIDVFYAAVKLTDCEYSELIDMLPRD